MVDGKLVEAEPPEPSEGSPEPSGDDCDDDCGGGNTSSLVTSQVHQICENASHASQISDTLPSDNLPITDNLGSDNLPLSPVSDNLPPTDNLGTDNLPSDNLPSASKGDNLPATITDNLPSSDNLGSLASKPIGKAMSFLRKVLADGEKPAMEVLEAAMQEGISKITLYRAKALLKVVSRKVGDAWYWSLPSSEEKPEPPEPPEGSPEPPPTAGGGIHHHPSLHQPHRLQIALRNSQQLHRLPKLLPINPIQTL